MRIVFQIGDDQMLRRGGIVDQEGKLMHPSAIRDGINDHEYPVVLRMALVTELIVAFREFDV